MAESTVSYKCPNCDAGLLFDAEKQMFVCEFCISEFSEDDLSATDSAERAEKAAIKKVRDYHEDILIRRSSIGGFAGGAILILSLAMLAIPAMSTRGSFETIPVIEEKL